MSLFNPKVNYSYEVDFYNFFYLPKVDLGSVVWVGKWKALSKRFLRWGW